MRLRIAAVVLAASTALMACGSKSECPGGPFRDTAFVVTVVDGKTGRSICNATVTAQTAGSTPEPLYLAATGPACNYQGVAAGGTFTLTADAPGYRTGTATAVSMLDVCGFGKPTTVAIALQPQ